MAYQIERTQTLQSTGKRWVKSEIETVSGWRITLATEDEARKICAIMTPSQPYILSQHEFDGPSLKVVEGGCSENARPIADVIEMLGEQDYYNLDGTPKTHAEIYGENPLWL